MNSDVSHRDATNSCKIVSEYFANNLVMDKGSKDIRKKQNNSKTPKVNLDKVRKKSNNRVKGQKDIRTLVKSKKNELMTYTKDFDLICKQSGIDVDPDQLQLAIALSKSLQDNKCLDKGNIDIEKDITCKQRRNKIRTTLQDYGFKTKNFPSYKKKRYKKNYSLILVSDTEKQQRIADRYAHILNTNVCNTKTKESQLKEDNVNSYLYNLTTEAVYDYIKDDEIFYVNDLVPKSLHKKCIFKDWSQIPGRPVSPKLERLDIKFKDTQCSQEELDSLLSGPIEIAQDIVKKNYKSKTVKSEVIKDNLLIATEVKPRNLIEIKSKEVFSKTGEDNLMSRSVAKINYKSSNNMTAQTNRSCSPDLFDDEETIIMDNSNDKIYMQDGVSERTMMVKEQSNFMELTNCIGIINENFSDSKHVVCLSQGSNKTRSKSNDFMDLTECVPTHSQKNSSNLQRISCVKCNENHSKIKDKCTEVIYLNHLTNSINNIEASGRHKKSLDDTIILVDEEYNYMNTNKKQTAPSSISKENIIIDLVDNQLNSSRTLNVKAKHSELTVDLKDIECVDLYGGSPERKKHESGNLIIHSKTIKSAETSTKKNIISIFDTENDRNFDNLLENLSSSSEKCNWQNSKLRKKKFLSIGKSFNISDSRNIEKEHNNQEFHLTPNYACSNFKFSAPKNLPDKEENMNYDVHVIEVEEVSNKISDYSKKSDDKSHNTEIVATKLFETNAKQNQSTVAFVSDLEFTNISRSKEYSTESAQLSCDDAGPSTITGNRRCENEFEDHENSDIDLTQQSDCSNDTSFSQQIIEIPDELGKRNDISIDYDEVCGKASTTRDCEPSYILDDNKVEENHTIIKGVSSSSQHSEVFDISDNEFNYSMNQYVQDNDVLKSNHAKFDIGGVSIIDELLNRKSLPENSKLRCSCSSNNNVNNTIDVEAESCYPVVALKYNENLIDVEVDVEHKSCEEMKSSTVSTPLKCRSEDNILIAKTPRHDDYVVKTDQVTPMPNYESMKSPERNEELDRFGIKPLKRKRAIQILTHIYNQTHPLMEIIPNDVCSPTKIRRQNNTESFPRRVIASQIDSIMTKHSLETPDRPIETLDLNLSQKSSKPRKDTKNSHKSREKRTSGEYRKNSNKEKTLYEETTLIPDIRNVECSSEDWVFQKREKAKVHSCRVPLHIAFHNYVSTRNALREAILRYEPINIDDIHKGLVASGYRYNPKDLLKFMDKKCITVKTADNSKRNKNT